MNIKLTELTDIFFGPHEKGEENGDIKYLVASHFDDFVNPSRFEKSYVSNSDKLTRFILKDNDVILTGKGLRLFAWAYRSEYGTVVPSSLFYILRIKDSSVLIGEYLACFLNSENTISRLKSLSMGTSIPSIQKNELQQVKIFVPPIEEQKRLVDLAKLMDEDVYLTSRLLEKKRTLKKAVVNQFINTRTIQNNK